MTNTCYGDSLAGCEAQNALLYVSAYGMVALQNPPK